MTSILYIINHQPPGCEKPLPGWFVPLSGPAKELWLERAMKFLGEDKLETLKQGLSWDSDLARELVKVVKECEKSSSVSSFAAAKEPPAVTTAMNGSLQTQHVSQETQVAAAAMPFRLSPVPPATPLRLPPPQPITEPVTEQDLSPASHDSIKATNSSEKKQAAAPETPLVPSIALQNPLLLPKVARKECQDRNFEKEYKNVQKAQDKIKICRARILSEYGGGDCNQEDGSFLKLCRIVTAMDDLRQEYNNKKTATARKVELCCKFCDMDPECKFYPDRHFWNRARRIAVCMRTCNDMKKFEGEKSLSQYQCKVCGKDKKVAGAASSGNVPVESSTRNDAADTVRKPGPPTAIKPIVASTTDTAREQKRDAGSIESLNKNRKKKRRVHTAGTRVYWIPTQSDIFFGRGRKISGHAGNIAFRELIKKNQAIYHTLATAKEKYEFTQNVLLEIHKNQGRFLNKDEVGWYEVSDMVAREKIAQALRETWPTNSVSGDNSKKENHRGLDARYHSEKAVGYNLIAPKPRIISGNDTYFGPAANQGIAAAKQKLGFLYEEGLGVTQDYDKARGYYELAAKQGLAAAQYNLGYMYDEGLGVTQDYDKARHYYELAAKQGLAAAQYNLGYMYDEGLGVTTDDDKAREYFELAAKQGLAGAQNRLGYMYQNGLGVTQDYYKARHYYELAADQGHATAQYGLGWMYYSGCGVTQSFNKARHYYELAAKQGHAAAQYNLGYMYDEGLGVTTDYDKAREYFELAAKLGHESAKVNRQAIGGKGGEVAKT
jgi:TPR repeat protein